MTLLAQPTFKSVQDPPRLAGDASDVGLALVTSSASTGTDINLAVTRHSTRLALVCMSTGSCIRQGT